MKPPRPGGAKSYVFITARGGRRAPLRMPVIGKHGSPWPPRGTASGSEADRGQPPPDRLRLRHLASRDSRHLRSSIMMRPREAFSDARSVRIFLTLAKRSGAAGCRPGTLPPDLSEFALLNSKENLADPTC